MGVDSSFEIWGSKASLKLSGGVFLMGLHAAGAKYVFLVY
jgi:hypothetical protein